MIDLPLDEFSRFEYEGPTKSLVKHAMLVLIITFLSLILGYLAVIMLGIAIFILLVNFAEMEDLHDVDLDISRHVIKDQFTPGETVPIVIKITNRSPRIIYRLEIEDILPKKLKVVTGSNLLVCSLDPKETIYLTYTVQFPERGTYLIGPMKVQVIDKSGMFIKRWYNNKAITRVYVVPTLTPIRRIPFKIRHLKLYGAAFISSTVGYDEDFRGIREYHRGDPIKYINWHKTAKSPSMTLHVNEYSMNMGLEAYLILDLTKSAEPIIEANIESLVSLHDFFLRHGARVGHILVGETITFSKARRSKLHFQKLARELATVDVQWYRDQNVLKKRLITQVSRTPEDAIIILISPLLDSVILETLGQIAKMRAVHVIWSYSIHLEKSLVTKKSAHLMALLFYHNMASELFSYRRQIIEQFLLEHDIPFFFWDVRVPFHVAIEQRTR